MLCFHLTGITCPPTTEFSICGSSCIQTCANPVGELVCEDICVAGCFCPQGQWTAQQHCCTTFGEQLHEYKAFFKENPT